jgi:thioredoxin 1
MSVELIKFEAEWCGPCKRQSRILEGFDTCPVNVVDIDEEPDVAKEYNVHSVPTLVIENEGEEVDRLIGLSQLGEVENAVESSRNN